MARIGGDDGHLGKYNSALVFSCLLPPHSSQCLSIICTHKLTKTWESAVDGRELETREIHPKTRPTEYQRSNLPG